MLAGNKLSSVLCATSEWLYRAIGALFLACWVFLSWYWKGEFSDFLYTGA